MGWLDGLFGGGKKKSRKRGKRRPIAVSTLNPRNARAGQSVTDGGPGQVFCFNRQPRPRPGAVLPPPPLLKANAAEVE